VASFIVGGVTYTSKIGWQPRTDGKAGLVYISPIANTSLSITPANVTPVTVSSANTSVLGDVFRGDPVAIKQGGIDTPSGIPSLSLPSLPSLPDFSNWIVVGAIAVLVLAVLKAISAIFGIFK
jgi:hypothetical protein